MGIIRKILDGITARLGGERSLSASLVQAISPCHY